MRWTRMLEASRQFAQWVRVAQRIAAARLDSPFRRLIVAGLIVVPGMIMVAGCRQSPPDSSVSKDATANHSLSDSVTSADAVSSGPKPTAAADDVDRAVQRLTELGSVAKFVVADGRLTEIVVHDGSDLTAEDIQLFGRLTDLVRLHILNCRSLNDEMVASLSGLENLTALALTNTVLNDPAVETIARSFPQLIELDLSSNTNMTRAAMTPIASLANLHSLTLVQTRFDDISTRKLRGLQNLRSLDLRGNMEAGNMTLAAIAELPRLTSFKHRSTAVTDDGMSHLADCTGLQNLLIQDFMITSRSGEFLAKLGQLKQLEIFRCQGFGSDGVLALQGLNLERLTLRDLPTVDDQAMQVFSGLPKLRRLFLHELDGVTDYGLEHLASLTALELLDIWSVPQMTDKSIEVLTKLPNLKELSLRTTDISDEAIDLLLAMPKLKVLTVKENSNLSDEALKRLSTKSWDKLDVGE